MGTYFALLAANLVADNGTLVLILPTTALQSTPPKPNKKPKGYAVFRQLITEEFTDLTVITTAGYDNNEKSFSFHTQIGEAIIIARRTAPGETPSRTGRFINLTELPQDHQEAEAFAQAIKQTDQNGVGVRSISANGRTIGTATYANISDSPAWNATGLANPKVLHASNNIRQGRISSGRSAIIELPVTKLAALGTQAPHGRHIANSIAVAPGPPTPPAIPYLTNHSSRTQRSVLVQPLHNATPEHKAFEVIRAAHHKAGTLQVSLTHRYNSQPLAAATTPMACLSGPHWATFRMEKRVLEHATAVWLNTTFGLVSLWGTFNRTMHGIGSLAKTYASQLTTLDLSQLNRKQVASMHRIYMDLSQSPMMPAS